MKRKTINHKAKINGYYINEFNQGFLGENHEGEKMLKYMGLSINNIPFSAAMFLQTQHIFWRDREGNKASISYRLKPDQIECFGNYLGKYRSYRLFREWNAYEDPEMIAKLESETIGELCMKCIYDNIT